MARFIDARIPVVFGVEPGPQDAVIAASGAPPHPAACACCIGRSPDAVGLDELFVQRVRGQVPWFTRVVVSGDDTALRHAIEADPVVSARFRIG